MFLYLLCFCKVQIILARLLDQFESSKNILNWTIPKKTSILYVVIVLGCILSYLVPGRYIILAIGLYEFLYAFMPQVEDFPMITRLYNWIESVPNDYDLDQIYYWDRVDYLKKKAEYQKKRLHKAKLRLVLDCEWEGRVFIKGSHFKDTRNDGSLSSWELNWKEYFLAVQGHRLVWWYREEDLFGSSVEAKAPVGELLLQGHCGISPPSIIDIKEIEAEGRDLTCLMAV